LSGVHGIVILVTVPSGAIAAIVFSEFHRLTKSAKFALVDHFAGCAGVTCGAIAFCTHFIAGDVNPVTLLAITCQKYCPGVMFAHFVGIGCTVLSRFDTFQNVLLILVLSLADSHVGSFIFIVSPTANANSPDIASSHFAFSSSLSESLNSLNPGILFTILAHHRNIADSISGISFTTGISDAIANHAVSFGNAVVNMIGNSQFTICDTLSCMFTGCPVSVVLCSIGLPILFSISHVIPSIVPIAQLNTDFAIFIPCDIIGVLFVWSSNRFIAFWIFSRLGLIGALVSSA